MKVTAKLLAFLKDDGVLRSNGPYMCVYYDRECPFAEDRGRDGELFKDSGNSDPSEWTYYCHLLKKDVWGESPECTIEQLLEADDGIRAAMAMETLGEAGSG